jgi:hypothetical protein
VEKSEALVGKLKIVDSFAAVSMPNMKGTSPAFTSPAREISTPQVSKIM